MLVRGVRIPCPTCGEDTRVIESGWSMRWQTMARRRVCYVCPTQFYTQEIPVKGSVMKRPKLKVTRK